MWPLKYIFNWLLENGWNKEDNHQKKGGGQTFSNKAAAEEGDTNHWGNKKTSQIPAGNSGTASNQTISDVH